MYTGEVGTIIKYGVGMIIKYGEGSFAILDGELVEVMRRYPGHNIVVRKTVTGTDWVVSIDHLRPIDDLSDLEKIIYGVNL